MAGRRIDPRTGELHWFQCVLGPEEVESVQRQQWYDSNWPGLREKLRKSEDFSCYGVEVQVPTGFHTERSRSSSSSGLNPYGGLRIELPRTLIAKEEVPLAPTNRVEVVFMPLHRAEQFFRADYASTVASSPPSRTETFLVSLRGFWNVEDTGSEENGFRILETPEKKRRTRSDGKRVYAPTAAHPDIFAECNLQTFDSKGKEWAPMCTVRTTYDGLFELEYHMLRADISRVREFDLILKEFLRVWIA